MRSFENLGDDPSKVMAIREEVMRQIMGVLAKLPLPYEQVGYLIPLLETHSLRLDKYLEIKG